MKRIFYILLYTTAAGTLPCAAQDDTGSGTADTLQALRITPTQAKPFADATYATRDTVFFPRLYGSLPYGIDDWQLHSGLNAQLGTSVTVGFGKHSPKSVGIGTHAAFMYAAPLTHRLSVAAGISSETFDWGGIKFRDARLTGVAAYKVNDFMNVYAYGSKSLMNDKRHAIRNFPPFGRDKWGGAVDFNLGRHVFVQFGIEQARIY